MRPTYEIVRYRPELRAQVVQLQTHLWSPDLALNAAYLQWKYERNPYVKEPLIYLAIHDGKVVGMRGFFGTRWECGVPSQQFTSLYADDTVVAPEHRRRGLLYEIMTFAFEDLARRGYDYVFNLSAGEVMLHASLSTGWHSAGWVRPMYRKVRNAALWTRISHRALSVFHSVFRRAESYTTTHLLQLIDAAGVNRGQLANSEMFFAVAPRARAMADLIARIGPSGNIRHLRDAEYFQWRFANPLSRYRFLFWDEEQLEGYLVLQEYTSGFASAGVVNIVDWEASNQTVKAGLLQAAIDLVRDRQLMIWAATLSDADVALLKRYDFESSEPLPVPTPPAILVRAVCRDRQKHDWRFDNRYLLDPSAWEMRMLYSMHG